MKKQLKQNRKRILVALVVMLLCIPGLSLSMPSVSAQKCETGRVGTSDAPCAPSDNISREPCKTAGQQNCDATFVTDKNSIINNYINPLIRLMTVLVGVAIVAMVVIAGIQYSSAGGDPSGVAAAKKKIINAVIALVAYMFALGFLQWLVPGGLV